MKKKAIVLAIVAAMALGALGISACSSGGASQSGSAANGDYSDVSLIATHEALGQDISGVTEVSAATCGECHGSWDEIVDKTDGLWEGVGQISAGNPHKSHAASGYECSDCHSLTGTSINQCDGCHNFDTPDGWENKDPETTASGVATEEPLE